MDLGVLQLKWSWPILWKWRSPPSLCWLVLLSIWLSWALCLPRSPSLYCPGLAWPEEKLVWNLGGRGEAGAIILWGLFMVRWDTQRGPGVLLDLLLFPTIDRVSSRLQNRPRPCLILACWPTEVGVTQRSELPRSFSEWSLCKGVSFASQIAL